MIAETSASATVLNFLMDSEEVPSAPSTPATPGAPLFVATSDGAKPRVSCSLPSSPIPLAKKVGAEFIGTFILMFAAIGTAIVNQKTHGSETLIGCAAANGLAVMIIIFSTGHISGAHLNPAVTISFAALKHFPWKNVPVYIVTQVLASVSAAFALKVVFHPFMSGGVTVPSVGYGQAFATEFIVSFILMFVVTAVATDTRAKASRDKKEWNSVRECGKRGSGDGPATGSSMNPVRTLGPAIAANNYKGIWVYLIAPIFGTLCGAGAYTVVKLPEEEATKPPPHSPSAIVGSFRSSS
ncbi:Aquaporin NIP6-1 NOD26-like intrinsic protein [Vigna angularis]|uniref:Aquaporin NIP6-1 NOD26-like intrinsic protein n=1 Tax=Phaseolus angularis TaxID=3914 RepID=A0A8T0JN76_PHAAN|nr:Aquaporin NIP6-1 NOD26-like intrinsic protein [Vigna angularis]